MCGRYILTSPLEALRQLVMFDQSPKLRPNYNVAPMTEMPIIRRRKGDRRCELAIASWGLIPRWATDTTIAHSTINARAETAATEPAFRKAFGRHRCLVPADGFFEWERDGKIHQPHLIRMKGGGVFAFAGLWSFWRDVTSFAIMTTRPNELVAEIHDRMPVILGHDDHDRWLDLDADPADVLKPCPSDWLEAYPVDKRVGNVRNNNAELIKPLDLSQ